MAAAATGDRATEPSGGGAYPPHDHAAEQRAIGSRHLAYVEQHFVPILRRRAWKRLASTIAAFRHELNGRVIPERFGNTLQSIHGALDSATRALETGDLDGGWKHLQAAQRLELLLLDNAELNAIAVAMRIEADKLNPWRKRAVTELLTGSEGQVVDAVRVFRAALLRDEHYNNEAYKDGIRRATGLWLAFALFLGLAALIGLAGTDILQQSHTEPGASLLGALLSIAVMGYLGAIVSAITSAPQVDASTRIPETVYSFRVTALRILVGPVSAIILYFAIQSNLYGSVLNLEPPDGYALLLLAFVAGFTERLVLRVVEAIAGRGAP